MPLNIPHPTNFTHANTIVSYSSILMQLPCMVWFSFLSGITMHLLYISVWYDSASRSGALVLPEYIAGIDCQNPWKGEEVGSREEVSVTVLHLKSLIRLLFLPGDSLVVSFMTGFEQSWYSVEIIMDISFYKMWVLVSVVFNSKRSFRGQIPARILPDGLYKVPT